MTLLIFILVCKHNFAVGYFISLTHQVRILKLILRGVNSEVQGGALATPWNFDI
jgi:hypothetical protein